MTEPNLQLCPFGSLGVVWVWFLFALSDPLLPATIETLHLNVQPSPTFLNNQKIYNWGLHSPWLQLRGGHVCFSFPLSPPRPPSLVNITCQGMWHSLPQLVKTICHSPEARPLSMVRAVSPANSSSSTSLRSPAQSLASSRCPAIHLCKYVYMLRPSFVQDLLRGWGLSTKQARFV